MKNGPIRIHKLNIPFYKEHTSLTLFEATNKAFSYYPIFPAVLKLSGEAGAGVILVNGDTSGCGYGYLV